MGAITVASIGAAVIALMLVFPVSADALQVERWSAKSNEKSGDGIMGETPVRTTLQVQTDANESLRELVVQMPAGSSVLADQVKVTVLEGLDRLDIAAQVESQNNETVAIDFSEGTPQGTMVMVEFNNMEFPNEEGSYGLMGTYTTVDGITKDLPESSSKIDVIAVSQVDRMALWLAEQDWVKAWNTNDFLRIFLNPATIVASIPIVFQGWIYALGLVIVGFPLAIPFGFLWAFLRMSKTKVLRGLGSLYINIVRGTPLFLQMYIAFFGLPLLGINVGGFALAVCVLVINSSAYMAEIFRAGIQSISKGQFEAARSLGMSAPQTMFSVIIPQTIRRVIPTMTSEFILLYKDTSLLAAVGVKEMMMHAKSLAATTATMTPYIVAAGFYLLVTLPLTKLVNTLEDRMADKQGGTQRKKKKKDETAEEVEA